MLIQTYNINNAPLEIFFSIMSQDFEHAFAISMHIPKFVFNLESVSMYKSGLLRITVTTIIELHDQNIK